MEEHGETWGPHLKMVVKTGDMFIVGRDDYSEHIIKCCIKEGIESPPLPTMNSLWRVIPNLAGPPTINGEEVTWYRQYGGRYEDDNYKGIETTPLLDKTFDLEYIGTCCEHECYKILLGTYWLRYVIEVKVRALDGPKGMKRKVDDIDSTQTKWLKAKEEKSKIGKVKSKGKNPYGITRIKKLKIKMTKKRRKAK